MDDERHGLPSASSMDRYHHCRSSLPLERLLRARGELPKDHGSKEATHGTLIHALAANIAVGDDPNSMEGDPANIEEAAEYFNAAKQVAVTAWGTDEEGETHIEKRLFLKTTGDVNIATGQPDLVWIRDSEGLVIDYKTGFLPLPQATMSWQLKLYAAMAAQHYGVSSITVAFIQGGKVHSRDLLDKGDLDTLSELIFPGMMMEASPNPCVGNGFEPSEEVCRYCPCRLKCPALNTEMMLLQVPGFTPDEFLPALSNFDLERAKNASEALKPYIKALDSEMNARAADDEFAFNEWHVGLGRSRRIVRDPPALCQALISLGANTDMVLKAVKLGVGDAESLYRDATKTKGAVAAHGFKELAETHVEIVPGKPSLQKRKKEQ
mgnify:CR=1 FL=1